MAVYVDNMRAAFGNMMMSHMIADTHAELLRMAAQIGVQRKWIQCEGTYKEHFDVCASKRQLAIKFGAVAIDRYMFVKIMSARRDQWLQSRITKNQDKPASA